MKRFILFTLLLTTLHFQAQTACAFSDGQYHYLVSLNIDEIPSVDFDKNNFIAHLQTNSSISGEDAQFLNDNLISVFRKYQNTNVDDQTKILYVIAIYENLEYFLEPLTESIETVSIYCNCLLSDGFFRYYSALLSDEIPTSDFNKTDYIQHISQNSNISNDDINFLNTEIVSVNQAFPNSSDEDLLKGLFIRSNSDNLVSFLIDYSEAIDFVEVICEEDQLNTTDFNSKNDITVINLIEGRVKVKLNGIIAERLSIYDFHGRLINQIKIESDAIEIKPQLTFQKGVYFFEFHQKTKNTVKKVLIR